MAIQFPADPVNGATYLYTVTQEEFVCFRGPDQEPQWACKGAVNDSTFAYQGLIEIQQTAPANADTGYIYSVSDGGVADASFGSLAGQTVPQWNLVIYTGTDWVLVAPAQASTTPWLRTDQGQIQPKIGTDNLSMLQGDYIIDDLDDLP